MGCNAIQFQKGLSVPESQMLYGMETQCKEALAQMRWLRSLSCPRCVGAPMAIPISVVVRSRRCC
jgi:hypothetical protein